MRKASRGSLVLWVMIALGSGCGDDSPAGKGAAVPVDGGIDAPIDSGPGPSIDGGQLGSLDEVCDGDARLSGAAVVDAVDGPYDPTLTYLDTLATTTLHITLTYDGGAITCFPAVPPNEPARLELVMAGMWRTDDGNFNETLDARVRSWGDAPDFTAQTQFVDLGGGWAPASLPSFGANAWVEFRGVLFPTSTSGSVLLHGDTPTWQAAAW